MNAAREIAKAYDQIVIDEALDVARKRYREALDIMRMIPSGTRDEDLTPVQQSALNQYEAAMRDIRILEGGDEE